MKVFTVRMRWVFVLLFGLAVSIGCSKSVENVSEVNGKVTLDGQPLPNASVQFIRTDRSSTSSGMTNANGEYELYFAGDTKGAENGDHEVKISSYRAANPDREPPTERVPEKVPAKYNVQTELKATVKDGNNKIDFDLKSDGPIIQPDASEGKGRLAC